MRSCTPNASRMEPATICSLTWSWVENATSITKNATKRPMRSAKVTNQPWPPCAAPRFLAIADVSSRRRFHLAVLVAVLLRQVGEQHLPHQSGALRIADHQHAVDDQRAIDLLVGELEVQLVRDRKAEQIGHRGAVERRQQRDRH